MSKESVNSEQKEQHLTTSAFSFLLSHRFVCHFCSFLKRKGIVVNETAVLLYGQLLTGQKYVPKANGLVEVEKQWAKQVLPFAYQTVVKVPNGNTHVSPDELVRAAAKGRENRFGYSQEAIVVSDSHAHTHVCV